MPSTVPRAACTTGSPGRAPCDVRAPGQTDCTVKFTRTVEPGGVGRDDDLVGARPDRDEHRPGRGLVAGVEPAQQGAVRHQLAAGGRAPAGQTVRQLGDRGAVLRGPDAEHPSRAAAPRRSPGPTPGRRRRPRSSRPRRPRRHGSAASPRPPARESARACAAMSPVPAADGRHDDDVAPGALQGVAQRVEGRGSSRRTR